MGQHSPRLAVASRRLSRLLRCRRGAAGSDRQGDPPQGQQDHEGDLMKVVARGTPEGVADDLGRRDAAPARRRQEATLQADTVNQTAVPPRAGWYTWYTEAGEYGHSRVASGCINLLNPAALRPFPFAWNRLHPFATPPAKGSIPGASTSELHKPPCSGGFFLCGPQGNVPCHKDPRLLPASGGLRTSRDPALRS